MHYRVATLSDLDAVSAGVVQLAEEQLDVGSRIDPAGSQEALRSRLAQQIVDEGVIVAMDDDRLVGFVIFSRLEDGLSRLETVGIVEYLFVEPDRRQEGIGKALLTRAEGALVEAEIDIVELEVLAANDEAMEFYQRCGYRPQRHRLAKRLEES